MTYVDPGAVSDQNELVKTVCKTAFGNPSPARIPIRLFCMIQQAGKVNTAFVQNYTVVYTAVDAAGNIGKATRTVVVGKSLHLPILQYHLQFDFTI